jgi:molybdopterin-guanine dinucleotide biosynthesis protein A
LKLTGIILSGGKSTRMGQEKGRTLLNGQPLIEYAVKVLSQICDDIMISSNSNKYDYLGHQVIKDEISGIGPMGGIYSCLKASTTADNIILSCDMPLVPSILLQYIFSEKVGYDAVIPVINNYPEPLCAYYNKSVVDELEKSIQDENYKLQEFFKRINVKYLEMNSSFHFFHENLFANINSQEDLIRIESLLSERK